MVKKNLLLFKIAGFLVFFGVADGARTHDNRNHNPGLYQLSYSHRRAADYSPISRLFLRRNFARAALFINRHKGQGGLGHFLKISLA